MTTEEIRRRIAHLDDEELRLLSFHDGTAATDRKLDNLVSVRRQLRERLPK